MADGKRYTLRPVTTPVAPAPAERRTAAEAPADPFVRPEAEDDDGYDPFSDRPAEPEANYQEDPWK